jgi:hypothetical protein
VVNHSATSFREANAQLPIIRQLSQDLSHNTEHGSKEIREHRREIEEAAPLGPLGVDGGELGELLGAHGLLGLQDLRQRRGGATPSARREEESGAVDGAAVAMLRARRRRALRGKVAVGARGGAGGGYLLDVHEGGKEVVLGADLVEAVAPGPPRSRSSGRRKAASDLFRRWCAPGRVAADGAGGGKTADRPDGPAGSEAVAVRPPRAVSLCVSPRLSRPAHVRERCCWCRQEWWWIDRDTAAGSVFVSRVAFGFLVADMHILNLSYLIIFIYVGKNTSLFSQPYDLKFLQITHVY